MENNNSVIDTRNQHDLSNAFEIVDTFVMNKYLSNLTDYDVLPLDKNIADKNISSYTRFYKLNKLVFEKRENNQNKLASVYQAIHSLNTSVITIIESDEVNVNFYIGIKSLLDNVTVSKNVLEKSFTGNFLGSDISNIKNSEIDKLIADIEIGKGNKTISSCSVVSAMKKNKSQDEDKSFIQGIEKIIESMKGEKYKIIIISDPVDSYSLSSIKRGYENIYSNLTPFSKSQITLGVNTSLSLTNTIGENYSKSITESVTKTHGSSSITSESSSTSANTSSTKNKDWMVGGVLGGFFGSSTTGTSETKTQSSSSSENSSEALGKSVGETSGSNKSTSDTTQDGKSETIQIESLNKTVINLMEKIDANLKRLGECEDIGVWHSATYFITDDSQTNISISSIYQSIMRGENSSVAAGAINIWSENDNKTKDSLIEINKYISKMYHPLFYINDTLPTVSPAMLVSSSELSIQSGLPQRSVCGLPVIEYASFAREVITNNLNHSKDTLSIGKVFHLGQEENNNVWLNRNSFCSHTFITGSTGSGKSNTVYNMIGNIDVPFLVIEPAKGEYKNVFGNRKDVSVYGSNPNKTPLLKINPFSFCDDIFVLEHIDRLVDIFNVCWPMYAAMPAILKKAILNAYTKCGWNLNTSKSVYNIFPNFQDVLIELKEVLEASEFAGEVKSNYTGALVTRIESLTNGIIGQMFTSNEIRYEDLFDKNVIIDLSRIGSIETKSMLMGILILKLSEYRMSKGSMNSNLKHITILEEAHNILKKTSTEQVSESANLVGKSVEMLSNSIAEMRTYGEGFIIVDQSPSAVDMSAIRNTNTKIILRLPEFSDRELVGKSANLNDEQIEELAKLETGVAAIYQNNWVEPVLCKVDKCEVSESYYNHDCKYSYNSNYTSDFIKYLVDIYLNKKVEKSLDEILDNIYKFEMASQKKMYIISSFENNKKIDKEQAGYILSNILDSINFLDDFTKVKTIDQWYNLIKNKIDSLYTNLEEEYKIDIVSFIIDCNHDIEILSDDIYNIWLEYKNKLGSIL